MRTYNSRNLCSRNPEPAFSPLDLLPPCPTPRPSTDNADNLRCGFAWLFGPSGVLRLPQHVASQLGFDTQLLKDTAEWLAPPRTKNGQLRRQDPVEAKRQPVRAFRQLLRRLGAPCEVLCVEDWHAVKRAEKKAQQVGAVPIWGVEGRMVDKTQRGWAVSWQSRAVDMERAQQVGSMPRTGVASSSAEVASCQGVAGNAWEVGAWGGVPQSTAACPEQAQQVGSMPCWHSAHSSANVMQQVGLGSCQGVVRGPVLTGTMSHGRTPPAAGARQEYVRYLGSSMQLCWAGAGVAAGAPLSAAGCMLSKR